MASVGEIFQRIFRNAKGAIITETAPNDAIEKGLGWVATYSFNLLAGNTAYLAFQTADKEIHARNRNVNVVDLSNQIIDVRISTLTNATVDTPGVDISDKIINANLNLNNSIELSMFDETTTLVSEGNEVPFSGTIAGDRKQAGATFITDEYVLKTNDYIILKFVNNGTGNVRIEYNSNGYQHD